RRMPAYVRCVLDTYAKCLGMEGKDGGEPDNQHLGPQLTQAQNIAQRHARMEDIAHDSHLHAFDLTELLPDAVYIEQSLGRVLVGTVASVHYPGIHMPAQ